MTPPITTGHFVQVAPDVRLHYASCGDAGAPRRLTRCSKPCFRQPGGSEKP